MSYYDKIINFNNMDEYKKICDKLHGMGYKWNGGRSLTSYRTDYFYCDGTAALYTYISEKNVCYGKNRPEAISARKFLGSFVKYDL